MMILLNLIRRNLLLYFSNKRRMMFSLLGALISVGLYLFFLKNNIQKSWTMIPQGTKLLDYWLIGGTIVVTAITTTGDALHQKIYDKESNRLKDLLMTDANTTIIDISYVVSAAIIGIIMQLIVYLILSGLFRWLDQISISWENMPNMFISIIMSSLLWTLFNMIILMFIKNASLVPSINAIINSCAGFFVGVYMPLGSLPSSAVKVLKFTPAPYNAAIFRNVLMQNQLSSSFKHVSSEMLDTFKSTMGLTINNIHLFSGYVFINLCFIIFLLVVFLLLSVISRKRM